jgi:CheY-like chemotaxis protein
MKPVEILLIEDNAGDIRLTIDALKDGRVLNNVNIVRDGEEAMDYLKKRGKYTDSSLPDIILLDLNLPKMNGLQVLQEIKNNADLKRIPVVILTSSAADEDVIKAYDNHVNCYIRKPIEFDSFMEVIKKIEDFWLSLVKLPNQL